MKTKAKPTMEYTKGVHGKQKKNIFPTTTTKAIAMRSEAKNRNELNAELYFCHLFAEIHIFRTVRRKTCMA